MNRPLESELHQFVDGRLSARRAVEVQIWLDEHPDDAAIVNTWRTQKDLLHRTFDRFAEARLSDGVKTPSTATGNQRRMIPRMAASVAWLGIGATIGYLARGPSMPAHTDPVASLPRQAAVAHVVYSPEVRHPVEVGADQEAHLAQWLSKRLGSTLAIPNLNTAGFQLVGGRLLPGEAGPAAQFMYENKDGLRLTLYVRKNAKHDETAFRFANEGRLSVFYWIDGPFGYALSGELPHDALLHIADIAYRQLIAR